MTTKQKTAQALAHLRTADPVMKGIIDTVGPYRLKLDRDRFGMLVKSIISQQISTGAARSIRLRLIELAGPAGVTPENLSRFSVEELRVAGVSAQKAKYMLDLSAKVASGEVNLAQIARYSDEKVIDQLTKVHGIGKWTAQMFLIFSLGRLDVYPHGDLGIRTAIRNRYGLDELPNLEIGQQIAAKWRPFASVASWYCWRSLSHKNSR